MATIMTTLITNLTHTNRNMKKILITFIIVFVAGMVSAQTYSKELEKAAKNGDAVAQKDLGVCYLDGNGISQNIKKAYKWLLESSEQGNADAMYHIALMAEQGRLSAASIKIPDVIEQGKSEQSYAMYMYEKAAELGQSDALIWLGRRYNDQSKTVEAFECYKKAANNNNSEAQYLLGYMCHYGIGTTVNESEAKRYFSLAAEGGYEEALPLIEEIRQKEVRDSLYQVRRIQEETKRKEEEAKRKEEEIRLVAEREARRKRLDSISAVTGVPAYYTSLKYQCTVIPSHSDDWRGNEQTIREFQALCTNDLFKYYGKEDLSGLDKTLYMKSEEYQRDKRAFEEKRKSNFLLSIRLGWEPYGWTGPDTKPYFEGNGFGFYTTISNSRDIPSVKKNHVMFEDNGIPVKNCVVESGGFGQKLFFACNDLEILQYIRNNYEKIDVVFVFKPSFSKNLPSALTYQISNTGNDFFIGSTLGIYVYNVETDELILDLSKYGRNIDSQAEKQKENSFFNSDKTHILAKIRNQNNKKYHAVPKKEFCYTCGGKGYVTGSNLDGVRGRTRSRCTSCHGLGYTEEHYY